LPSLANGYGIALVLIKLRSGKKTGSGRTELGLKKVFQQKYLAFEGVKRL